MAYESKAVELIRNTQQELAVVQSELERLKIDVSQTEANRLKERLAVLEDRVSDLKTDRFRIRSPQDAISLPNDWLRVHAAW